MFRKRRALSVRVQDVVSCFYAGALAVRDDAKKASGDHSSNKPSAPAPDGSKGGTTTATSQLANKLISVLLDGNHHLTDESLVPLFHKMIVPCVGGTVRHCKIIHRNKERDQDLMNLTS